MKFRLIVLSIALAMTTNALCSEHYQEATSLDEKGSLVDTKQPENKKTVRELTCLDEELIIAHKKRFKEWEDTRLTYLGCLYPLGAAIAAYGIYKYVYPEASSLYNSVRNFFHPTVTPPPPLIPLAEHTKLDAKVDALTALVQPYLLPPAPVHPTGSFDWFLQKGKNFGSDLVSSAQGLAVFTVKSAIVSTGAGIITRSPLFRAISKKSDYFIRDFTLLSLLDRECYFAAQLQHIRKIIMESGVSMLRDPILYQNTVVTAMNGFVRETEKVIGYMEYVKDLCPETMLYERALATGITDDIRCQVSHISTLVIASFNDMRSINSVETFVEWWKGFVQETQIALIGVIQQMELFGSVQIAVGLSELGDNDSGFQKLRDIVAPRPIRTKDGEDVDIFEVIMGQSLEEYMATNASEGLLQSVFSTLSGMS